MTRKILIILLALSLFSCHYISQNQFGKTRIRAVVVNPKKSEFYISKDFFQQKADTLHLTAENDVNAVLDSIEEGLYVLYLFPEYQTIYLKPNDSLAMHINIDEFDESLSFSGGLGFENNLLVDLFLINEKQSEQYYNKKYEISQKQLVKLVDSFTAIKQKLLNDYEEELKETTKKFKQIVALYINGATYSIKEDFVRAHPKEHFSKDFLAYRDVLKHPIADTRIIDMYNFADTYLTNSIPNNNKEDKQFYQNLLIAGKEKISDKSFKKAIFTRYCYSYITNNKISIIDTTVANYFEAIKDIRDIDYCKTMIKKNNSLQEGRKFPSIQVKDIDGRIISLDSLLEKRKSIVSFWDLFWKKSFNANQKKMLEISKQFPDIQLIVLNKNCNNYDLWKQAVPSRSSFKYYQIVSKDEARFIMPYSFAQVYLLKKDTIYKSMVNMFNVSFKNQLIDFNEK